MVSNLTEEWKVKIGFILINRKKFCDNALVTLVIVFYGVPSDRLAG